MQVFLKIIARTKYFLYLCTQNTTLMKKILLSFLMLGTLSAFAIEIPHDSVPDDHLAWFNLKGPVQEVVEYDFGWFGKKIWRFDRQGRLIEYFDYINPFTTAGGCVFGLYEHFRYAYDKKGKIIFLETFNADNNVVDDYDGLILELFPHQDKDADLFLQAEKESGDSTYCWSKWSDDGELQHYKARVFDRFGNWIEDISASEDDYHHADVRVREIHYFTPSTKAAKNRTKTR